MNKHHISIRTTGFIIAALFLWLSAITPSSYAQTPEPVVSSVAAAPSVLPQGASGRADITFAQFGQPTFELYSPIDQQAFTFEIPYRWAVVEDVSYLDIHYDMVLDGNRTVQAENSVVNVFFNETLVSSFTPKEGKNQTVQIPIPAEAIQNADEETQRVSFIYYSGQCDDQLSRSMLVINDSSFIHFEYTLLPLAINLADFPRPLVQNTVETDSILIIIPDNYSDANLSAAASVAATMGQRTFGDVNLELITAGEATPERLADSSAIIIGKPDENLFLRDLYQRSRLPTILTPDNTLLDLANQPIAPDHGILQETLSDFSENHVYLTVTGGTDEAVKHAAQALSVLSPRYGFEGDLIIIEDFQEAFSNTTNPVDTISLADLDFRDKTFYGIDTQKTSFDVFIPANWRLIEKPSLILSYAHANTLEPTGSGLVVNLNGQPVGSAPIDPTRLGERQVVIELPETDFNPGTWNRIEFESTMNIKLPDCVLPDLNLAWMRINNSTQLYLPHIEEEASNTVPTLEDSLSFFISRQDLSDLWFSLPENPTPEELQGVIHSAAWLGSLTRGPGFAPTVSRGVIDDINQLHNYHVIAFGLPSNNPTIAMINEALPQPFVPGEDNLRQEVGNIVYRLPNNFSLGLLQTLPAPWKPGEKAVLVATGTTPEGETWAIDTLTGDESYYDLYGGDVAFISGDRIEIFDSTDYLYGPLGSNIETLVEEETDTALEVVSPTPETPDVLPPETANPVEMPEQYLPDTSSPAMINWLIYGLIGAGLMIAIVGGLLSRRKNKSSRTFENGDDAT